MDLDRSISKTVDIWNTRNERDAHVDIQPSDQLEIDNINKIAIECGTHDNNLTIRLGQLGTMKGTLEGWVGPYPLPQHCPTNLLLLFVAFRTNLKLSYLIIWACSLQVKGMDREHVENEYVIEKRQPMSWHHPPSPSVEA